MADLLQVVITEDGSGYYLSDGETETEESVEWGQPLEFDGVSYLADCSENGEDVTLAKVIDMSEDSFEVVSEGEDDGDEEGVSVGPE